MVELAWYTLRSLRGHFENHFRIYIYVLEMCGGTTGGLPRVRTASVSRFLIFIPISEDLASLFTAPSNLVSSGVNAWSMITSTDFRTGLRGSFLRDRASFLFSSERFACAPSPPRPGSKALNNHARIKMCFPSLQTAGEVSCVHTTIARGNSIPQVDTVDGCVHERTHVHAIEHEGTCDGVIRITRRLRDVGF